MARRNIALALALLAPQAIWADLTIRYKLDVQFGPAIPPAAAETAKQQVMGAFPAEMAMRVKGNRCSTSFGPLSSIIDVAKSEITLLNPGTKQFATIPAASYADKLAGVQPLPPAAQQALQSLKIDVQNSKTGQTAVINGIQAEDNRIVLTMDIPGSPISIRMEMHEWLASAAELDRVAALKEIGGCSAVAGAMGDPGTMIQKLLGQVPGAGDKLSDAIRALSANKGSPGLKMEMAMYMPGLAAMMQAQGGAAAPPADANAPIVTMLMSLSELSLNTIPDSEFQVPAGYTEAPVEDLLKALPGAKIAQAQPQRPLAQAQNPGQVQRPVILADVPTGPTAANLPPFDGPVAQMGNGVAAPKVTYQPQPGYTEEARRAKVQGSVTLSIVVDPEGAPRNIKVIRSLDPGLDQKAMDAVSNWKFQPGMKDGQPVAVQAQVEVTFRLLDNPPNPLR